MSLYCVDHSKPTCNLYCLSLTAVTHRTNLLFISASLAAGQVSWGMEEPTWSECTQTGAMPSEMTALLLYSVQLQSPGCIVTNSDGIFTGMVKGGNCS